MTNSFRELTQEVHISTCQLGFLMWETAFRQQGMFLDHWIRIENEAFSLLQAAAARMMPSIEVANQENGEAEPNQGVQDSSIDLDCVLVAAPAPPSANVEDCAPRTAMALQAEALAPVAAKRARKAPKRAKSKA